MDISIVICTKDDPDILDLLESINEKCEIIIVCNSSPRKYQNYVREILKLRGGEWKILSLSENRLSLAREIGTQAASYDKVIHVDTDCIFTKTACEEFSALLEVNFAVNGLVDFAYNDYQSAIVAKMRSFGLPGKLLCPSIGFRKDISNRIGGYYFDKRLTWIEDSEFNNRLHEAGIGFVQTKHISCIHKPLTFKKDLCSAFNYGKGAKLAALMRVHPHRPCANWFLIIPMLKISCFHGIYALVWNLVYCSGYFITNGGRKWSNTRCNNYNQWESHHYNDMSKGE